MYARYILFLCLYMQHDMFMGQWFLSYSLEQECVLTAINDIHQLQLTLRESKKNETEKEKNKKGERRRGLKEKMT